MSKVNLVGQKFGRLTVLKEAGRNKYLDVKWLSICVCGNEKISLGYQLTSGNTKSCGCLHLEQARIQGKILGLKTTHGMYGSREYRSWCALKQRCSNPKTENYKNYGGRGIRFCKRWETFENFYADMGKRPENTSIDRIDNDGNYEPGNCKWSTIIEQNNNTSKTKNVII